MKPRVGVQAKHPTRPGTKPEPGPKSESKLKSKRKPKPEAKASKGGVILLVALYLPICILAMGMVLDLGLAFVVRETAQAACDLGALAGVQELDWDQLAGGHVVINVAAARQHAASITLSNLTPMVRKGLVTGPRISVVVINPVGGTDVAWTAEPAVRVEVYLVVRTFFLRWLPGLAGGIPVTVRAEARCVERTGW